MSAEGEENHYATAANFGGDVQENERQPFVKKVTVPESIKRRVPSKHYVSRLCCKIIYSKYHAFTTTLYNHLAMAYSKGVSCNRYSR